VANLSKKDLSKDSREETFLKKFFHMGNHMNIFAVKRKTGNPKEGQFEPNAITFMVDGVQTVAFEPDQTSDYEEALAILQENLSLGGTRNKVLITGKFKNTNSIDTISLSDLEKTSEFGGQTGGKRVNLGFQFEKDFYKSLNCEVECVCEHTKYEKAAKSLVKQINDVYKIKGGLSDVDGGVAAKNQKRPLTYSSGLYVSAGGKKTKNIGSTVTDITTTFGGKKEMYLSLKYGNTLTFINSGVSKIFTEQDYKNNFRGYNNNIGNAIFDMFAIDRREYAQVFNLYGKGYAGKKVDVTNKCNKAAIQDLLQYAIGYGYWMVHGKGGSSVDIYEMTEQYMKKASNISGKVILNYGGSTGKGKRLDIHLESSVYKFMFNLRNKQGGKYPSHIMCDYKKK